MLQQVYVGGWRAARSAADRSGLLRRLESARSPTARHMRTMFAIHDVHDLGHLDLPWWTYPAIERVAAHLDRLEGRARVFEYGSGASSLWLGRRAAEVLTVEHDARFVDFLRPVLTGVPSVTLLNVPARPASPTSPARTPSQRKGYADMDFTAYVHSIDDVPGDFDLIVVDGRARTACLEQARSRLADGGMIIFDNSNRPRYRSSIAASGLHVDHLRGWAPCLPYKTETALLARR